MKVLIISLAYLPFVGGAELAVKEITDRIDGISAQGGPASGWDFDMVTVNLDGKQKEVEQVGRIKVYRIGKNKLDKYFFPFAGFSKAQQLHQEHNYDAVWAIMANQAGLVAIRLKKKFPQIKYLLTLQEGDSLKRIWSRTWFMRPLYRQIYQQADFIQPISTFLANRANLCGYQGRMAIVPNGVDLSNFSREFNQSEVINFRKQLGLLPDDKVVTTISRLVYKNGVDILVKAAKNLSVKVLIIGSGKLEIKLKSLAQELGVRDKILFLGYIGQKDLPQYLKISDVFVRTSRSEGLGTAFLEAMASGVPVVGTKIGGIPDFLKENETGLFCELSNPTDLAGKIQTLLVDHSLREKLIKNGRDLVLQNYDWQGIATKIKEIIQNI